ncbi:ATP-NAD kinase [Morchella conica CCBAS932]|uniref:ATP-NAD kinase n=1 Tax=Morchella conica CCBAS932 TaxID=1392247 RepID=A0A3N4L402_9PEZI|nr:ATP-NAD kinase [Morchella conica CCBAS932]
MTSGTIIPTISEETTLQLPPSTDHSSNDHAVYIDGEDDDEDNEHVLQITFDPHVRANRRRKSSIVSMERLTLNSTIHGGGVGVGAVEAEFRASRSRSSCFIHSHLEAYQDADDNRVNGPLECNRNNPVERIVEQNIPPFMSKSELSDMVLGVGELSKRFSNMRIKIKVKTVMILTKTYDKSLIKHTRRLAEWMLSPERGKNYIVYIDSVFKDTPELDIARFFEQYPQYKSRIHWWDAELCATKPHTFDMVLTLGGDGTVLYASWLFQKVVPPVFSFALGSLGFLTKFDFPGFQETLSSAIKDGVMVGLRLRFQGAIMRCIDKAGVENKDRDITAEILDRAVNRQLTHRFDVAYTVLNEIVVDRGPNATMSATELYGDDMHLTTVQADGVCIATPTGSTAYNLAAGGSLCYPEIPAMLVSPICAHSLTFRPLILPDSMVLRVGVPYDARTTAWVSFDGRQRIELQQGDYVMITASRFPFPSVQSKGENKDWFDSIRRTMNWGVRARQEAFT